MWIIISATTRFCDVNYIVPEASSTSELIYTLLDREKITRFAAEALYMGIVHDTGVFRHSNTAPETLETAADLLRRGIERVEDYQSDLL